VASRKPPLPFYGTAEREFFISHIGGRTHYCFNRANAMRRPNRGVQHDGAARRQRARRSTEPVRIGEDQPAEKAQLTRATMRFARLRILTVAAIGAAALIFASNATLAQTADAKPTPARPQAEGDGKKIDEFAEAARVLGGPAANPECVQLGRNAVRLLLKDDLDTALRHLDLYDRFGCPSGHIQATFRCLLRQGTTGQSTIDPKVDAVISARIHSCWINPDVEAGTPSAAAPSITTNR
jgi:hypothetical protein